MVEGDGKEFIYIGHKAQTELGRLLSDTTTMNLVTKWGVFKTLAGYSVFLRTGCLYPDVYKDMTGTQAAAAMRDTVEVKNPNAGRNMRAALFKHVMKNEPLRKMLVESTLPFKGTRLYCQYWERLREQLKSRANMP